MKSPHKVDSLIVAGRTVVIGTSGRVSVLDRQSQKTLLTEQINGVPYGLAVANGRLYVSTDKGMIYCFGDKKTAEPEIIESKMVARPVFGNGAIAVAEEIIRQTGVTEGYCLNLGCGDGALAYALAKRTKLHIYAIDSDPRKVALARKKLDAVGLYGVRVTVHRGNAGWLAPYEQLVNIPFRQTENTQLLTDGSEYLKRLLSLRSRLFAISLRLPR